MAYPTRQAWDWNLQRYYQVSDPSYRPWTMKSSDFDSCCAKDCCCDYNLRKIIACAAAFIIPLAACATQIAVNNSNYSKEITLPINIIAVALNTMHVAGSCFFCCCKGIKSDLAVSILGVSSICALLSLGLLFSQT